MKNFLFAFLLLISTCLNALDLPNAISSAIKSGNVVALSSYFESTIDLSIPGNEGMYSKSQSELILKKFFSNNQPNSFKILNNGNAKNNTEYSIGTLISGDNNYRVYILYKTTEGKTTISELRIELDN